MSTKKYIQMFSDTLVEYLRDPTSIVGPNHTLVKKKKGIAKNRQKKKKEDTVSSLIQTKNQNLCA